ncbi:MAG: ABC transporter substrate-binding protein [Chlorobiaceae bacterium]|nr:ABC transporter substrate-binding protein [Chlorobiaceae bacterium]
MNRRDFLLKTGLIALGAQLPAAVAGNFATAIAGTGKVNLKIGYLPITDHLLLIAAFREQFKNLTIQPVRFSSWPENAEALKSGAIDGSFLLTPMSLALREKGIPIRVVLLGHRNGSAITVKNSGEINRIEDLKGKTIAVPSQFSTHNILLRKILAERGLDAARDVRIIDMPPPEMVIALASGRINGYIVAEPFGAQAEAQHVGKVLMLSKDIWPNHICCVLNLRENVIRSYPEAVQELVGGLSRTASFIEANPVQAATESQRLLGQKPQIVETVLTSPKDRLTFNNLAPDLADFSATRNLMVKFGLPGSKADLGGYIDDSFAKRVLRHG